MSTVIFFGIFDPEYSRNKVLIEGFKENHWRVLECSVNPKIHKGFSKYFLLIKKWQTLKHYPKKIIFVAHPAQAVVWLARFLAPRGFVVFDAFTSLYDSNVFDRQRYGKWSARGIKDYVTDWLSLRLATIAVTDTNEHIKYFCKTFSFPQHKFHKIYIGSSLKAEKPQKESEKKEKFTVQFHGTYIPLHGIRYMIRAAKILENEPGITFRFIGGGQEYEKMMSLNNELGPKNTQYLSFMPLTDLLEKIKEADVILGIFGLTAKAQRVIPNKIFEGLVLGKAMISGDTNAIRELFTDKKNILLAKCGDPQDLADKILEIYHNPQLQRSLGENAYELYQQNLQPKKLVSDFLKQTDFSDNK